MWAIARWLDLAFIYRVSIALHTPSHFTQAHLRKSRTGGSLGADVGLQTQWKNSSIFVCLFPFLALGALASSVALAEVASTSTLAFLALGALASSVALAEVASTSTLAALASLASLAGVFGQQTWQWQTS